MSTELTFTIPKSWWLSANQRLHWAVKARATRNLRQLAATTDPCTYCTPPEEETEMNHRVRTTTTIEQWQDGAWKPIERTIVEESGHMEHVVNDDEECWCNPTTVKVPR